MRTVEDWRNMIGLHISAATDILVIRIFVSECCIWICFQCVADL